MSQVLVQFVMKLDSVGSDTGIPRIPNSVVTGIIRGKPRLAGSPSLP